MSGLRRSVRLGDVLALVIDHRGRTPKKLGGSFAPFGVQILSAKNVGGGVVRPEEDPRFVPEEMWERWMPEKLKPGDVLLTSEAPLGEVAFLKRPLRFGLGQRLFALRADRRSLHPRFLFYALQSPAVQQRLRARETGTTAQGIRQSELVKVEIDIPPVEEQDRIATMLGALDDKIEVNRRLCRTLEAMARAIFKSWCVDFDPVVARAEGRQPAGMGMEIADLFPTAFSDSKLGRIPEDWTCQSLGDLAENARRGVDPGGIDPDTPYIGLEHMPRQSIALSEWGRASDVASGKAAFRRGEVLFGKLRPYFHKVGVAPIDGVCSTDILVIVPSDKVWFGIVLGHVSSTDFVAHADASSVGTKMPRARWQDLARYDIVVPPRKICGVLSGQIRSWVAMIETKIHESRTLASLRDTLLPGLLSGEVQIRVADKMVEQAV